MHGNVDFHGIGLVAWGVIATLLAMSVLSIAIIVERTWVFRRAVRQSKTCALETSRLMRLGNLREAHEVARRPALRDSHLARLIVAGLREWGKDDGVVPEGKIAQGAERV